MYFLVQIQRSREGVYTKGVVVKETLDAARQSFHAYLGAYGFSNSASIDYVQCMVLDDAGRVRDSVVDNRIVIEEEIPTEEEEIPTEEEE